MKKRILSLMLISSIFCGMLTGCGGEVEVSDTSPEISTEVTNELGVLPIPSEVASSVVDEVSGVVNEIESTIESSIVESTLVIEEPSIDLEIEVFDDENLNENNNSIEKIDFNNLKETDRLEVGYENVDVVSLIPSDNMLMELGYEDLMNITIASANQKMRFSISTNELKFDMYQIDDKLYTYLNDMNENAEVYNWAIADESVDNESMTGDLGPTNYGEVEIIEVKYDKSLIDDKGNIYDVLIVSIDERTDEEKEMLAYETPNGIMYLGEGVTTTINGVKYGGEDGIAPLSEAPINDHKFYVERSSQHLKAMEYIANGTSVMMYVSPIEDIILPSEFNEAVEVSTEEITWQILMAIMSAAFSGMDEEMSFGTEIEF